MTVLFAAHPPIYTPCDHSPLRIPFTAFPLLFVTSPICPATPCPKRGQRVVASLDIDDSNASVCTHFIATVT